MSGRGGLWLGILCLYVMVITAYALPTGSQPLAGWQDATATATLETPDPITATLTATPTDTPDPWGTVTAQAETVVAAHATGTEMAWQMKDAIYLRNRCAQDYGACLEAVGHNEATITAMVETEEYARRTAVAARETATLMADSLLYEHEMHHFFAQQYEHCMGGWVAADETATAVWSMMIYNRDLAVACFDGLATKTAMETREPCAWRIKDRIYMPLLLRGW